MYFLLHWVSSLTGDAFLVLPPVYLGCHFFFYFLSESPLYFWCFFHPKISLHDADHWLCYQDIDSYQVLHLELCRMSKVIGITITLEK